MALMLNTRGLTPETVELLRPTGSSVAHDFRVSKLERIITSVSTAEFFSRDAVFNTFEGTQFDGENHRRLTPYLQEAFSQYRDQLMQNIDSRVIAQTVDFYSDRCDVLVVGSGPHGAAIVANLREKYPMLNTVLVESGPRVGGQFRSYGPKPAYMMNSRVRKADRRLPALPRTPGSINPLGSYAPLELSDLSVGNYAMNTDMGDVCAVNGYMSATTILTNATVTEIRESTDGYGYPDTPRPKVVSITINDGGRSRGIIVNAKIVVVAAGLRQQSALSASKNEKFSTFETAKQSGRFMDTAAFYRHFANHPMPLEMFSGKKVMLLGAGDSALTCLEALLGSLPTQTYGALGVGRHRPSEIEWIGAPRDTARGVERCLRSRYKNGIVQALPRDTDRNSIITLASKAKAETLALMSGGKLQIIMDIGTKRYPYKVQQVADIVIDCTNKPIPNPPESTPDWDPDFQVGPAAKAELSPVVRATVANLRIKENTASLWATMDNTDKVSMQIGAMLTNDNLVGRNGVTEFDA